MTAKTWFITGSSRGFGREWSIAALERGDRVAATARDVSSLDGMLKEFGERVLAIRLDVTDRVAVFDAVRRAYERFGTLDIVVNNAGYGQFGMLEELTEQEAREQLETNLFGALWVTQAVLPYMRDQGSGHILQVSSIAGITAFEEVSIYNASKWALEGMSQALAQEVTGFGIKVTLIEPGGYSTDWGGSSARRSIALPAYDAHRLEMQEARASRRLRLGEPGATRDAILRVVDSANPPLRIFLGDGPLALASRDYEARLATWRDWQAVSVTAHGGSQQGSPTSAGGDDDGT